MNKTYRPLILMVFALLGAFPLISTAQESEIVEKEITYAKVDVETGEGAKEIGFSPISGFWDPTIGLPKLTLSFPTKYNDFSFEVVDVEWTGLSPEEERLVNISNNVDPEDYQESTVTSMNGQRYGVIVLVPLVWDDVNGKWQKMSRVKVEVSSSSSQILRAKSFTSSSVLSSGSGSWYRIGVDKDGLYKIDYTYLQDIGVDVSSLRSDYINIYGNAQGMLSIDNSAPRVDDITVNNILMVDGGDGLFDPGDYMVFYGKGPHTTYLEGGKMRHRSNNFTDTAYYFLNINAGGTPARIGQVAQSTLSATHTTSKFNDFIFLEEDERNLAKSGQEWMGDLFDVQLSNTYSFNVANLSVTDSLDLGVRIGISTPTSVNDAKFTASYNGKSMTVQPSIGSGQGSTSPKARLQYNSMKQSQTSGAIDVSLNFDKDGMPSSRGYLDYIEINAVRNLVMEGSQMEFYYLPSVGAGNVTAYNLSNASNVAYLWEITEPTHPAMINFTPGSTISFKMNSDSLRRFIAFTDNQYFTPTYVGEVNHQNLHGLSAVDMLIITAPEFMSAAQRLAAHHQDEGLTSHIVTQQQIFNEFSSGMRDPVAIRHFLKMFYDRAAGDPNLTPKFCTIIGDCSYDYRNRLSSNSDFVITYESEESMSSATHATDDFYVILDDSEMMRGTDLMDMAVGRIPVRTLGEANDVVDKIIAYSTINSAATDCNNCADNGEGIFGDWRNIVVMVSDDADNNAYFNDVENMYGILSGTHPDLNIEKIHTDAYQETVTPGGERNPDATEAIRTKVERGALLVNYIGHGGELGWAHEEILNVPTIRGWTNSPRLPVFMTATCEFSRYDDHDRVSAGEYVVLNRDGGGIGLFTTTRLVFTTSNRQLARVFYDTVADKVNGAPQYIGDIYKGSKNKFALNYGSSEARKFTYLGDPAVKFALPQHFVVLDSINGIALSNFNDTLKALSKVVIVGHVEDDQGNTLTNFDGFVYPKVYDKISELTTLGNSSGSYPADFEMWKNVIYKGKASVNNGYYRSSFIIPQDISYTYGTGRFSLYAEDGEEDGNGFDETAMIGGINANAPADNEGPSIALFLNNENFVDGGITDATPVLLAKVFDENGVNMVGNGIGHNIEFWIDDASESVILNDYYEADVDTYQSGQVRFQLNELDPGEHTVRFKIWDVYNNSSEETISFTVVEEAEVAIEHLLNYPNPFTTSTEFSFEHNQVCDYLDVQIQVFTISGKLVKSIEERVIADGFRVSGIHWDGRDEFGDKIGIGTYIYKVTVQNEAGAQEEKYEKLFVLN
ncbi:type IX secretion system sortase PorU [Parvicella tangerina]|nr:type IX secretion system sortase PorU [Parvicella tangerina]